MVSENDPLVRPIRSTQPTDDVPDRTHLLVVVDDQMRLVRAWAKLVCEWKPALPCQGCRRAGHPFQKHASVLIGHWCCGNRWHRDSSLGGEEATAGNGSPARCAGIAGQVEVIN